MALTTLVSTIRAQSLLVSCTDVVLLVPHVGRSNFPCSSLSTSSLHSHTHTACTVVYSLQSPQQGAQVAAKFHGFKTLFVAVDKKSLLRRSKIYEVQKWKSTRSYVSLCCQVFQLLERFGSSCDGQWNAVTSIPSMHLTFLLRVMVAPPQAIGKDLKTRDSGL